VKLVRYGEAGRERPGLIDADGEIRDLSSYVDDLAGPALSDESLERLGRIDHAGLPLIPNASRLGPPVAGTRNFVCIGLNYSDHAAETGAAIPREPIVFLKSLSALCGPNDGIILPKDSSKTDWEAELAIIIGSRAHAVSEAAALNHVAGYAVCNDVSEREWQNERGGAWDKGKGFDSFGPVGPWLVTRNDIADPQNLDIFLDIDHRRMQSGNTSRMIFNVRHIVSYVSTCITLYPGDIISTGTPPGVGIGRKPPEFLKEGSIVRLGINGLGEQVHTVRRAP